MTPIRTLLAIVLLALGFSLGMRWQAVAVPTRNVEVVFMDGRSARGDLAKDWANRFILRAPDGHEAVFSDFRMLTIEPSREITNTTFWRDDWRILLTLLGSVTAAFIVFSFKRQRIAY